MGDMKKAILLFTMIFSLGACSLFDKKEEEGGGGNPNKTCINIVDQATKDKVKAEHGVSCKIGDWYGVGDSKCSSSEAACKSKN